MQEPMCAALIHSSLSLSHARMKLCVPLSFSLMLLLLTLDRFHGFTSKSSYLMQASPSQLARSIHLPSTIVPSSSSSSSTRLMMSEPPSTPDTSTSIISSRSKINPFTSLWQAVPAPVKDTVTGKASHTKRDKCLTGNHPLFSMVMSLYFSNN